MQTLVKLEQAQQILLDLVTSREEKLISLFEAAGQVLSQDIKANRDIPPFDRSPLDGYAMRAEDISQANSSNPVKLRVIERIAAGYVATKSVSPGTTIGVMTGAPIPAGADVVIKFEEIDLIEDHIMVNQSLKSNSNIIPRGEDVTKDEIIAPRGTLITPPILGLIASQGINQVPVFPKLKVAILSTGDELLEPDEEMHPGKIYNSNLYTLYAHCIELGIEPISLGIVVDNVSAIAKSIRYGLENADIVISTGGVSVGDYDLFFDAMEDIEAKTLFWKVDIKPGSAMLVATKDDKPIIGLSGNPASALITFELIVVPLLKKMLGLTNYLPPRTSATLVDGFGKASPLRRFLRGNLYHQDGSNYIKLTGSQTNGVLKSLIDCNVLIDVPAGSKSITAGEKVEAYIIDHKS
ncbi:MAG TPA: gephyrin-like molybdotransferase Glp [Syntrophomonadaceae bacterium]|nr:gephyrin-like molybdotransferase Glp [Syntrophomonadaceae bacterium]